METQSLKFTRLINAPQPQIYRTFTNSTSLREWMCDVATVDPKLAGRFYVAWNSGYYACGEYTELKENSRVAFTWYGRGEPGPTKVEVSMKPNEQGTLVEIFHKGLGTDEKWSQMLAETKKGWETSLENLASVLETGEDLRFVRRPMLGIGLSDFNADIARQFNIPVTEGVRIDTTLENMGAHAAGLRKHDVIISIAGLPVTDFASLGAALEAYRADDTIEVVYYRGSEKLTTPMTLSRRPLPAIPQTARALADFQRKRNVEIQNELEQFFSGISDAEASHQPGEDEWSVKDVLAHLIQGERYWQFWMVELIGGYEAQRDGWGGNEQAQIEASVSVYADVKEMLVDYERAREETVQLIARFPDEFVTRKGSYWRLAYGVVDDPYHHRLHMDQMRAALEAARKKLTSRNDS